LLLLPEAKLFGWHLVVCYVLASNIYCVQCCISYMQHVAQVDAAAAAAARPATLKLSLPATSIADSTLLYQSM
jgi:hypothetical protein